MRRNVLGWLTDRVPDARQAIILTHNVDFLFVQAVLASRLRQSGNPRLTVFADAMSAGRTYAEQHGLLEGLGSRFRVVSVDLGPGRRFHPKALMLAGPDGAALAIGSGNLTHGGMAANREAWTFAVPGGDGAALLPAFRGYLERLVATLPLADTLEREVSDTFSPDRAWVRGLPAPSGLAGAPGPEPLLDQIARLAGNGVRSVDVLAPYHDDEGAALATIAARFGVPVTCWLQRGREGLCKGAAARLPSNVTLSSVDCADERPASLIHAKVIAFRRDADVVVAVGSANCSRAALTLPGTAGNAELMAVAPVAHATWEAFNDGLARSGDPPSLPDEPPSAEWEAEVRNPFRILAARRTGDRLEVAFRAPGWLAELAAEADGMAWPALGIPGASAASFGPVEPVAAVSLSARDASGVRIVTPSFWVDDEDILGLPASVRRLAGQIANSTGLPMAPDEFRAVLELFRDYLVDPETARPRKRSGDGTDAPTPYDPAEVFSEAFGRPPPLAPSGLSGEAAAAGILAIVESLFSLPGPARTPDVHTTSPEAAESTEEGEPPSEPEAVEPPRRNAASGTPARLLRTVAAVSDALCRPAAAERSMRALGTDIALAAVLLVKGRADGLLDPADYREATRTLWVHLFFGHGGVPGSVPGRLAGAADAAARETMVAAMVDPRLSAALALWSMAEWRADDAEGAWFRLSAGLLHQREPWLFAGARPEAMFGEISRMAAALLSPGEAEQAVRTWTEVVQAGEALRAVCGALRFWTAADLLSCVGDAVVAEGDLVWAQVSSGPGTTAGHLGCNLQTVRRERKVKASVVLLGEADARSYLAASLVPVRAVIQAGGLDVPAGVTERVVALATGADPRLPV